MNKINIIVIAVLVILCIVLAGYAASLNSQLGAEKTKTMQLNDQIAGLQGKAVDLQAKLNTLTSQANNQAGIVSSLQGSLDAARSEINNLKATQAELESKLKAGISDVANEADIGAVPVQ